MKKNYTVRVRKDNKTIAKYQSHSKRRILHKISTIKWKVGVSSVHLRVNYGKYKNNFNRYEVMDNVSVYYNKKDLLGALRAFDELKEKDFV